jgi:acyl-CoA-binding protein
MKNENLHREFLEAVEAVNSYANPLPADILLKLYAYYKIANKNSSNPQSKIPLINAFKANALIQAQNVTRTEAMKNYIEIVKKEVL